MSNYKILTINPGSTSTKIAIYENEKPLLEKTLRHSASELSRFEDIIGQFKFRLNIILDFLDKEGFKVSNLSAVVGRGGILKPITSGTYEVNEQMLNDLQKEAKHASNLGAILAYEIAQLANIPAYIVDPVVVDELDEVARISGIPEFPRKSMFHALNQKAVGRKSAYSLGKEYEDCNLIIAHLGGGISVGAHKKGRVVDVNNALDSDGPFSPERSGTVPIGSVVEKCFSGER